MSGTIPTMEQIDELHRKIAPSQAAYDLIHTHCVIVADIARRLARRRNALFMRRCTLPADAPERTGHYPGLPERASAAPHVVMSESPDSYVVSATIMAKEHDSPDSDKYESGESKNTPDHGSRECQYPYSGESRAIRSRSW